MQNFEIHLRKVIESAIGEFGYADEEVTIGIAKEGVDADICTAIACQLSSRYKKEGAYEIASRIVESIGNNPYISSITPEKNGFINISLSPKAFEEYYSSTIHPTPKKNKKSWKFLEIISANPTGYLHIGHTRHGILTDTLGNIFEREGYDVRREYLVNDSGNQIKELIKSFWYLWKKAQGLLTGIEDSEDKNISYSGSDMIDCVNAILAKDKGQWFSGESNIFKAPFYREIKKEVIDYFLKHIKELANQYQIKIDYWRRESDFVNYKNITKLLREMEPRIVHRDGAIWLNTSAPEDEETKEEVLIKNDGHHTYFAQDAIYHDLKLSMICNKDEIVDVLGCDHYGHAEKLLGYIKARGKGEENRIKIIWMQLVKLMSNGEAITMSKRDSTVLFMKNLEEYMTYEEVRWFFVSQAPSSTLEIDVEKLKSKDYNNPVYYVMYAYSRICQILKKEKEDTYIKDNIPMDNLNKQEKALFIQLMHFDATLAHAAETYSPHKLPQYLFKLAQMFHSYYETTRVLSGDQQMLSPRLALLSAIKSTIKEGLSLMKIKAREEL